MKTEYYENVKKKLKRKPKTWLVTGCGIFTYSVENLLVCTGHALKKVKHLYRKVGLKIEAILYGSWAGNHNKFSYQDVIVSPKIN